MATIDWSAPIELDNGHRAEFVQAYDKGGAVVTIWSYPHRTLGQSSSERNGTFYYNKEGTLVGFDRERYHYIVNVDDSASFVPEDWS